MKASPGSELEDAKRLALRVLAFHARTETQLRDRLSRAGFGAVTEDVLAWLRGLGYVDDVAYARRRALALLAPGRAGPRMAERRLLAAGVSPAEARSAVAEALAERGATGSGSGDEVALCRAMLARRRPGVDPDSLERRERARLSRFLLGRGFSAEAVARVLRSDGE